MATPLDTYKATLKEFGVTEEFDVPGVAKVTFVQTQINEQKQILNRLMFDYTIASIHQSMATDDQVKDAHRKKADDFRGDVRQIVGALKVNLELISGLRKEYNLESEA